MGLNLDIFTYITGIASLVGLFLQFKDSFAEHRETRKVIVVGSIGVFLGTLISSLRETKIEFSTAITPLIVLLIICALILFVVSLVAVFTKDHNIRMVLGPFPTLGFPVLFAILGISNMSTPDNPERELQKVTIEELIALSTLNESHANYDRAIRYLKDAARRLDNADKRKGLINSKIQDVEAKQIDFDSKK
jgi:hypothetical protein